MFRGFIAKISITVLFSSVAAFAQAPVGHKVFEVATIKAAPPINPMAIAQGGKMHVGVKFDASRVDIGYMAIADLICMAYKIKPYQLAGPDWMKTERFDILAKLPDGATKDDLPEMMTALLADRFKLTIHKETKDHAMYALVVAKGGPKLKEAAPDAVVSPDAPPPAPEKGTTTIATNEGAMSIKPNAGGRGATVTTPNGGTTKMTMGQDGNMHMELSKASMTQFAEMLARFVDKPVVDKTEIKGNYQIELDLSMADLMRAAASQGVNIPAGAMPGGRGGGGSGAPGDAASDPGNGGSVFTALQSMGLKLDARKDQVETVIVDHVEKTPTEN